ncbi:hypothetical protein ADUPG1_004088, partial [Aduncisulcus paluster]
MAGVYGTTKLFQSFLDAFPASDYQGYGRVIEFVVVECCQSGTDIQWADGSGESGFFKLLGSFAVH